MKYSDDTQSKYKGGDFGSLLRSDAQQPAALRDELLRCRLQAEEGRRERRRPVQPRLPHRPGHRQVRCEAPRARTTRCPRRTRTRCGRSSRAPSPCSGRPTPCQAALDRDRRRPEEDRRKSRSSTTTSPGRRWRGAGATDEHGRAQEGQDHRVPVPLSL